MPLSEINDERKRIPGNLRAAYEMAKYSLNTYNHIPHEAQTIPRWSKKRPPDPCNVARFRRDKK